MKKVTIKSIKIAVSILLFLGASAKLNAQNFTSGSQVGSTGNWFYNAVAKDLNGDGYEDIISIDAGSNLIVVLNNGSGGFNTPITLGSSLWTFKSDDLDNDGDIDIVASSNQSNTPGFFTYKNNGSGSFTLQSSTPTNITLTNYAVITQVQDLVIFDADGDGKKDILLIPYISVGSYSFNQNTRQFLFLNTSSGSAISFSQNSIINTNNHCAHGMAADIDKDGDQDLVLDGGGGNGTEVYKNNGSGSFSFTGNANGYSGNQFFYDWNNDGYLDIMTMDDYNGYGLRVKLNDGAGNFAAGVQLLATSNYTQSNGVGFLADMNGDGLVDAVYRGADVLFGNPGYINVYINTGCGFSASPNIISTQFSNNTSIGILKIDANHDNKPDVFVTTRGEVSRIAINNIATATPPVLSTITAVQNASRCGAGIVTVGATASNGGTISWWDAASGGSQITTGSSLSAVVNTGTPVQNFWADATLNGCTSARVKVMGIYKGTTTSSTTNATVLVSQLPYVWVDGKPFNAAGTYTKTMPGSNSVGCDSIATLNLTVLSSLPAITGAASVCVGSSTTYSNSFVGGVWSISGRGTINASGVVTGMSAGATVVKYSIGNVSVSKNINVYALPAIPSIAYQPGTIGVTGTGGVCKNKTFTLTGTPTGGSWSSTGVISINASGIVTTGNTLGACSVTYAYTNSNGCMSNRTIANTVINCGSKGVGSQIAVTNEQFTVYPNPAKSVINIRVDKLTSNGSIVITDLYGKQVKKLSLSIGNNTVDVSNLAKGMYLVSMITESGKQTQKIVVE